MFNVLKKGVLGVGVLGVLFVGVAAVDVYGEDLLTSRVAQKTAHNARCVYAFGWDYAVARRAAKTEGECRHSSFALFGKRILPVSLPTPADPAELPEE